MEIKVLFNIMLCSVVAYGGENETTSSYTTDIAQYTTILIQTETYVECNVTGTNNTTPLACLSTTTLLPNSTQNMEELNQTATTQSPNITTQSNEIHNISTSTMQTQNTTAQTVESNATTEFTFPATASTVAVASSTVNETEDITTEVSIESTVIPDTTVTVTSTPAMTTQDADVTTANSSNVTRSTVNPTIVEKIKDIWNESVQQLNFSLTSLNETEMLEVTSTEVIEMITQYFLMINETELEVKVGDTQVDDLASQMLSERPELLESEIRDQFNSSQNLSLHVLFSSLYWFHDNILNDVNNFQTYAESYSPAASSDNTSNNTSNATTAEFTTRGLLHYIMDNVNGSLLFSTMCNVTANEGVSQSICPTTAPPTTTANPLPGPATLESTWNNVVTDANYSFMSDVQVQQLQSITPKSMTTALINYVKSLSNAEITILVDTNVTQYVSSILRSNGKQAADTIGLEAAQEFTGAPDREDLFYVYLNLMNNLFSNSTKFEEIMERFVSNSSSTRRKRDVSKCDRSTINPDGICCYTIVTEGSDARGLRDAVCDELQGGDDCLNSFTISDSEAQSTTTIATPISQGLSTWEIVGIALGVFFAVVLISIVIFFVWKRCNRKKSKVNPQTAPEHSEIEMEGGRTVDSTHMRASTNVHPSPSTNDSANS